MQGTIRYLSIVSPDPERLARFYTGAFGMREMGRSSTGDVSVTDGHYNLSLLAARPELGPAGPWRMGIAVDDRGELEERLQEFAVGATLQPDQGGLHFGEYTVTDPQGIVISVSTSRFGLNGETSTLPAIRHAAMCEAHGDVVADFYLTVFGLQKAFPHMWRSPGRFLSDGTTNLALLGDVEETRAAGRQVTIDHTRPGVSHYGFEAPSAPKLVEQLPAGTKWEQRLDRPDPTDYYRIWDPDGNHFDLRAAGAWTEDA